MSNLTILGDTSGSVVLQAPAVSGSTTLTLPATSGTVLTTASTGTILQVVQATLNTIVSTASTTYQASGLIGTITPKFSTSKILVNIAGGDMYSGSSGIGVDIKLYRQINSGGYSSLIGSTNQDYGVFGGSSGILSPHSFTYLDSPATTSSVNYQPYFRVNPSGTAGTINFNVGFFGNPGMVTITLMEVAG